MPSRLETHSQGAQSGAYVFPDHPNPAREGDVRRTSGHNRGTAGQRKRISSLHRANQAPDAAGKKHQTAGNVKAKRNQVVFHVLYPSVYPNQKTAQEMQCFQWPSTSRERKFPFCPGLDGGKIGPEENLCTRSRFFIQMEK